MINNLQEIFEKRNYEYIEFKNLNEKYRRSGSPDICAFILLDALAPSGEDIISASEHDIIFLSTKIEDLKKNATEEDIIALIQCGIQYDSTYDCLTMFK